MKLNRAEVMELIYGRDTHRRFTQDSPVLPDVWIRYAEQPRAMQDLLLTPYVSSGQEPFTPGKLAKLLNDRLTATGLAQSRNFRRDKGEPRQLVYNQASVAVRLWFDELIRVVLPLSFWWQTKLHAAKNGPPASGGETITPVRLQDLRLSWVQDRLATLLANPESGLTSASTETARITAGLLWTIKVAGTIAMANAPEKGSGRIWPPPAPDGKGNSKCLKYYQRVIKALLRLLPEDLITIDYHQAAVHLVSHNRKATIAVWKSAPTVKADAVRNLFKISCSNLTWAIVDSGIDARHPAFLTNNWGSSVFLQEDFLDLQSLAGELESQPRPIDKWIWSQLSPAAKKAFSDAGPDLAALKPALLRDFNILVRGPSIYDEARFEGINLRGDTTALIAQKPKAEDLQRLNRWLLEDAFPAEIAKKDYWAQRSRVRATYDFSVIRKLLSADDNDRVGLPDPIQQRLNDPQVQQNWRLRLNTGHDIDWSLIRDLLGVPHKSATYPVPEHEHGTHVAGILGANWPADDPDNPSENAIQGICPDINFYDLRVMDKNGQSDEFTIMAALQFIRHLNSQNDYTVIHGVNLSLSILHDVRNYACGCTPICEECSRLIGAGILVVAAAGNEGYTLNGEREECYQAISITDPGNTEAVLTVGSTHRDAPHSYGVSYFSSRGPTGDGRIKPDVVAPGEKIESTVPNSSLKTLEGTSMATPHVSGVAALLMARNSELIGRPQRIKEIICTTATDLGRERYFQGHGLVDALRALQSV